MFNPWEQQKDTYLLEHMQCVLVYLMLELFALSVIIKSIGKVWSNKEYFLRKFPIARSTCIQTLEIILVLSAALNSSFSFVNDGISSLAPNVLTVSASLPSLCHHKLNISKNQNFLSLADHLYLHPNLWG